MDVLFCGETLHLLRFLFKRNGLVDNNKLLLLVALDHTGGFGHITCVQWKSYKIPFEIRQVLLLLFASVIVVHLHKYTFIGAVLSMLLLLSVALNP